MFVVSIIILTISFGYVVFASPPDSAYIPGQTLNPSCAPGAANCTVTVPAVSGANADITSLSGLTTPLSLTQGGTGTTTTDGIKTALSLNNVENTALSTWTGSSNLTTLGTVTTGTWYGDPIANSYIASSSLWNTAYSWGDHASAGYLTSINSGIDDKTNSALLQEVLSVNDNFSSLDTFNQWAKANSSVGSSITYSGGKLIMSRNSSDVLTSGWYNKNSIGKNVVVSADALHIDGTTKTFNLRQTDNNNMLQTTLTSGGVLSMRKVVNGSASSIVASIAVDNYDSSASNKIVAKVYNNLFSIYVLDDDGYVVETFNAVDSSVGNQTGKINGLASGSTGDGVSYDNFHSHTMGQLVNIVCLGDSNTSGSYNAYRADINKTYPNLLAREYLNDDIVVWNKGVSSDQTTDINARLSTDLYANYVAGARNVATLLVGMGDFTIGGKTAAAAWSDMATLVSNIKNNKWELIVFTYFPTETDAVNGANAFAKEFNEYIRVNADVYNYKVIDLWNIFADPDNDNLGNHTYYCSGGGSDTHINESGHELIFEELKKYVYKTSKKPIDYIEKLFVRDRIDVMGGETTPQISVYPTDNNGYIENITGSLRLKSNDSTVMLNNVAKLTTLKLSTNGGVDILNASSYNYPAVAFRVIPGGNSGGYSVYGTNMMSLFEVHDSSVGTNRFSLSLPETASKGILQISRGTTPRDFVWAIATGTAAYSNLLTLKTDGALKLTDSLSIYGASSTLVDDGSVNLPDTTSGWGEILVGDNEEYGEFRWSSAGVVSLLSDSTANVTSTDADGYFCIFDNGTQVVVKNRLGSTKIIKYKINY